MNESHSLHLHIGDFLRVQTVLRDDPAAQIAYLNILIAYWLAEGPLEGGSRGVSRASKCSPQLWRHLEPRLMQFFEVDPEHGLWRHSGCDAALERYKKYHEGRSLAASKAAKARWDGDASRNAPRIPTEDASRIPSSNASRIKKNASRNASRNANPKSSKKEEEPLPSLRSGGSPLVAPSAAPSSPRPLNGVAHGARLPDDWSPDAKARAFAEFRGLDPDETLEQFRDWFVAQPGAKGRKTDWNATWRTWCRREGRNRALSRPLNAPSPRTVQTEAFYHVAQDIERRSRNC